MKKKNDSINESEAATASKIRVKFINDYIGKLGSYYKDKIYELPMEIHTILKIDCEEV